MDSCLSIGTACNLKCKFCYNDLKREKENIFFPIEELLILIKKIRKEYNYIIVVGGEPFLYPDILKILVYIKKLEFGTIWFVTNGTKLSDIGFTAKLYQYGVTSLEFSIHAHNETLEKKITQRTGLNFKKRELGVKNIFVLNKKFKNKISLNSNTVINKINYKNIIDIIKYISSLGIKNIGISFIYDSKGLSEYNRDLLVKYSDVIDIFNNSRKNFISLNINISWLPYCLHNKIRHNRKKRVAKIESIC